MKIMYLVKRATMDKTSIGGVAMLAPKGVTFAVKARPVEVDNPELVAILTPSPGEGGTKEPTKRKRKPNENPKVRRVVRRVHVLTRRSEERVST